VKKILCIGNNSVDTDHRTIELAAKHNSVSHGLISGLNGAKVADDFLPGYYHTSIYDLEYFQLLTLCKKFDTVIILDQPKEEYSHPDSFYNTVRLANELSQTQSVIFLDTTYATTINFFEDLVNTNKSFCIFPFIELLANNGSTNVCCRSTKQITRLSELKDFQTDIHYTTIRNKMIAGEKLPEYCSSCYDLENRGILSARIQETIEWANRLNFSSIDDLKNIKHPAYYEVRPNNVCNLQCRSCSPDSSHLIAKEYKILKISDSGSSDIEYTNFDFINFTNLKKLYVAGGEPTAMIEFYDFLDNCIKNNKTDFELLINTNGTKLSDRFKSQLKHFKLVSFIISIDGYAELNHYIRWPSNWDKILQNTEYLHQNFSVSFSITVSIYNVLTLYQLIYFLNRRFPNAIIHCQFAETPQDRLSALNFPYPELVIDQLKKIQNLNCYKNDRLLSSFVDGITNYYDHNPTVDLHKLRSFFEFNDKLDASRNIALTDYIPELACARQLI